MKLSTIIAMLFLLQIYSADLTLMRTEYDTVGHSIGFVEDATALSGDDAHFYTLNSTTGEITTAKEIPDQFDIVTSHSVTVSTPTDTVDVEIVDGLDYLVSKHEGRVITEHQTGSLPDTSGNWASYNNLWGDGTATPNSDYRIVMLVHDYMPDSSTIIWDTPGLAKDFGGSSVWNYTNFMFGARKNQREELIGFPFCIDSLAELTISFDYTPVIGDDQFKVALNMFLTDTHEVASMNKNRGDFFFVLDQKGKWIPPYDTVVVEDTTILGKQFTLLYDTLMQYDEFYERRRVIIKDDGRLQKGELDLLAYFDRFAGSGMLNKSQYIPNIQFGVEVTSGFGAIQVHHLDISKKMKNSEAVTARTSIASSNLCLTHHADKIQFSNHGDFHKATLFSLQGRELYSQGISGKERVTVPTINLATKVYILTLFNEIGTVQKLIIKD